MIELSHKGDIALLRLAHGKANALDIELCQAIARRLGECRSAAGLVLTGQGGIFSAGVDLLRVLEGGPGYVREFLPALSAAFEAVFLHPRPVVAAINGHAIAGGCVLACAADRRLMVREAGRIGVTELLVGVPFPQCAFEIMRAVAAPRFFHEILYYGGTYTPDAAVERGLVDEVLGGDRLLETAVEAAERLGSLPADAFALTKRQIRQPCVDRIRQDGPGFDAAMRDIWLAPDTHARIRDYVARVLKKS
jgi:enoyl-CoA hydratase